MPTITAAVAREQGKPLTPEQLQLDDLRPGEARVRMVATGICHTDAIVRDGVHPTPPARRARARGSRHLRSGRRGRDRGRGTLPLVGAAAPGTVAPFEIGLSLVKGWTFKTIIQGSPIPQQFISRLVALWQRGRFPFDKMIRTYKLDDINLAFSDSASGETVKPVVVN